MKKRYLYINPRFLIRILIPFFFLVAVGLAPTSQSVTAQVPPFEGLLDGTPDPNYTSDPNQMLEFLDLTVTYGRTYTDISGKLGPGDEFGGHRYATELEIRQLFENAGIQYVGDYLLFRAVNWVPVNDLIDLVGQTVLDDDYRVGGGFTAELYGGGTRQIGILQARIVSSEAMAYFSNTAAEATTYGHWLVRIRPPSVGGEAHYVNKIVIMAPWIALAAAIIAGGIMLRRRKAHS